MRSTGTSPRHRAPSRWCRREEEDEVIVTVAELGDQHADLPSDYRLCQDRRAPCGPARRLTVAPRPDQRPGGECPAPRALLLGAAGTFTQLPGGAVEQPTTVPSLHHPPGSGSEEKTRRPLRLTPQRWGLPALSARTDKETTDQHSAPLEHRLRPSRCVPPGG